MLKYVKYINVKLILSTFLYFFKTHPMHCILGDAKTGVNRFFYRDCLVCNLDFASLLVLLFFHFILLCMTQPPAKTYNMLTPDV
jgi:hypothetical protein